VKRLELSVPEFGFIVSTRAALAAGVGLLAGASLTRRERRLVGLALLGVGAVTTVPAVFALRRALRAGEPPAGETNPRRPASAAG
jgi:hypothetical protein